MTTQNDILKMQVICTIQLMKEKIGMRSNFNNLWKLSLESLQEIQEKLIPVYNAAIKSK